MNNLLKFCTIAAFTVMTMAQCPSLQPPEGVVMQCMDPNNGTFDCISTNITKGVVAQYRCKNDTETAWANSTMKCICRGRWKGLLMFNSFANSSCGALPMILPISNVTSGSQDDSSSEPTNGTLLTTTPNSLSSLSPDNSTKMSPLNTTSSTIGDNTTESTVEKSRALDLTSGSTSNSTNDTSSSLPTPLPSGDNSTISNSTSGTTPSTDNNSTTTPSSSSSLDSNATTPSSSSNSSDASSTTASSSSDSSPMTTTPTSVDNSSSLATTVSSISMDNSTTNSGNTSTPTSSSSSSSDNSTTTPSSISSADNSSTTAASSSSSSSSDNSTTTPPSSSDSSSSSSSPSSSSSDSTTTPSTSSTPDASNNSTDSQRQSKDLNLSPPGNGTANTTDSGTPTTTPSSSSSLPTNGASLSITNSSSPNDTSSSSSAPITTTPTSSSSMVAPENFSSGNSSSTTGSDGNFTDFQTMALTIHNKIRANHNSQPLVLNQTLNEKAQAWAETLLNNQSKLMASPGKRPYAENLFKISGGDSISNMDAIVGAMKAWASSDSWFNYTNPKPTGFSQIVWNATTQLGVGLAAGNGSSIVVATYYPRGNIVSFGPGGKLSTLQFKKNVFPSIADPFVIFLSSDNSTNSAIIMNHASTTPANNSTSTS